METSKRKLKVATSGLKGAVPPGEGTHPALSQHKKRREACKGGSREGEKKKG